MRKPTVVKGKEESLRENCAAGFSQERQALPKGNHLHRFAFNPSLSQTGYGLSAGLFY